MGTQVVGLQLENGPHPASRVFRRAVLEKDLSDLVPYLSVRRLLDRLADQAIHATTGLFALGDKIKVQLGFVAAA